MKKSKLIAVCVLGLGLCFAAAPQNAAAKEKPIGLETQGSFAVGGTTVTHPGTFSEEKFLSEDGQKAYGDHAYVFYQIPAHTRKYPLVFQHGGAQTKRTWESTPDGRDGFQNIFLRKHYSVYLIHQPLNRFPPFIRTIITTNNHNAICQFRHRIAQQCDTGLFIKPFTIRLSRVIIMIAQTGINRRIQSAKLRSHIRSD